MLIQSTKKIVPKVFILVICNYIVAFASDFYQDSKGLYSFVPPRGWVKKSFSDPRAKVEFNDPANPGNSVRIIAGAMEKSTIAEFKNRKPRLQRVFPGATVNVEDDTVSGLPAVKFIFHNRWQQYIYMFWTSGYEYSISFTAVDESTFQKLDTIFHAVLATFQHGRGSKPNEADIKRSKCANWLRLVELFRKAKNSESASYYEKLTDEAGCKK